MRLDKVIGAQPWQDYVHVEAARADFYASSPGTRLPGVSPENQEFISLRWLTEAAKSPSIGG